MQKEIFTVSEINSYIKKLLQQDTRLNGVLVRGEISNFTRHSSGHLYFSLKDKTGTIKCVMFRGNAQRLQFQPAHGMQVLIGGYVAVYERDGLYQLYVEEMPLFVIIDSEGNNLYETGRAEYLAGCK